MEHYTRAIQSCLRTQKPVAATLSGGRDSGSVVSIAAPLLARQGRALTAFTSVPWLPPGGAGQNGWGTNGSWPTQLRRWRERTSGMYPSMLRATESSRASNTSSKLTMVQAMDQAIITGSKLSRRRLRKRGEGCPHRAVWKRHGLRAGNGSASGARKGLPGDSAAIASSAESNAWLALKRQVLKPLLTPGLRVAPPTIPASSTGGPTPRSILTWPLHWT